MPTRRLYGQTYDEFAIVAFAPIPVDIGGGTINITGGVSIGAVTVNNTNASPVPVSDAGGSITVDDGGGSITVDGPLTNQELRAAPVPVSGPLTRDQLVDPATTVKVSGPLTDAQLRAAGVPVVSSVATRTPATASVTSSASSVLVLAGNANRRGLMVSNQSTSKLFLSFSNPATAANSFIQMDPGAFLLLDQQMIITGSIYGIWTNASGTAQVTEFV